jgi:hypothetical protein
VLCISSISFLFMNYLNHIYTMYSPNSTFPISSSYNASRFWTRYDVVLLYVYISTQNGPSFLERYTSRSKWLLNQEFWQPKTKRQKSGCICNTSTNVLCAPWGKCFTVCLVTTDYKEYVCLDTRYGLKNETEIDMIWYDMIYVTAIGLTPGGSSTHLHTNNT